MQFDSTIFLFLALPIIIGLYFVFPKSWRNAYLFVINILLYAFGEPFFIFLLLGSMAINYAVGILIGKHYGTKKSKIWLIVGIVFNLLILFFFKYFMSANQLFNSLIGLFTHKSYNVINIALPIGISFYTFQALSYLIDIYRGQVFPQRNFIKFGVYFSFFAQISAGPIVRYKDIQEQINNRTITIDSFAQGLKRFLIGLTQKLILANFFSKIVDTIFNTPANTLGGATAWLGIILYTLQIYFDFAGYSSMAIGMAKMFGFDFKENFKHPYISSSIKEFWSRWHISLSSWFRDYVYIPMGGNRKGFARMCLALFVTFVLSGVWHGSTLNFLVWGAYHGLFIILEKLPPIKRMLEKTPKIIKHIATILIVMVGWVFFRAPNLTYAFEYLGSMLFIHGALGSLPVYSWAIFVLLIVAIVGCTPLMSFIKDKVYSTQNTVYINLYHAAVYTFLLVLFLICIPIILSGTTSPFIYTQF